MTSLMDKGKDKIYFRRGKVKIKSIKAKVINQNNYFCGRNSARILFEPSINISWGLKWILLIGVNSTVRRFMLVRDFYYQCSVASAVNSNLKNSWVNLIWLSYHTTHERRPVCELFFMAFEEFFRAKLLSSACLYKKRLLAEVIHEISWEI